MKSKHLGCIIFLFFIIGFPIVIIFVSLILDNINTSRQDKVTTSTSDIDTAEVISELKAIYPRIEMEYNKFDNIYWFKPKLLSRISNKNYIVPYFAVNSNSVGNKYLRLKMQYVVTSYNSFNATDVTINYKKTNFLIKNMFFDYQTGYDKVYYSEDILVDKELKNFLVFICLIPAEGIVEVRYSNYRKSIIRKIYPSERRAMKDILYLFNNYEYSKYYNIKG